MKNDIIKKIVIAVIIVIAILLLLFIGKEVAVRFFGMKTPSISKSTHVNSKKIDIPLGENTTYKHVSNDKYIYFVTTDKVIIIDDNGNEKATLPISVETPCLSVAGKYVALGDLGKNNVYIINDTEIQKKIETTKPIKNISVNTSGNCVVVTEGDMHKRDVILYNEKGEEMFVWTSGTKLVFDAVVANNNKNIIISSLDTQGSTANTVLSFYNISKEEPISIVNFENEIIADLTVYENYVYCIGESKTEIYAVTGDKKGEIPYSSDTLLSYKTTKSGLVMTFEKNTIDNKRYSLSVYNKNGSLISTHDYDYVSKSIDATNNHIVMSREGLINILDYNGREQKLIDTGFDITDVSFFGNSNKILGFTGNVGYIIGI